MKSELLSTIEELRGHKDADLILFAFVGRMIGWFSMNQPPLTEEEVSKLLRRATLDVEERFNK